MSLFHDEEDGPAEPVKGMPEALPDGEDILWQGQPSAVAMAFGAFRLRWVLAYFFVMTVYRLANLSTNGGDTSQLNGVLLSSLLFCAAGLALIFGLSFVISRAAVFTITNHRVVLRHGAAIRKYVNVPFSKMSGAQLKRRGARVGDISLQLDSHKKPPYLHLWPFARPFKYSNPQPTMRGVKDAESVAQILARAVFDHAPDKVRLELGPPESPRPTKVPSKTSIPAT